VSRFGVIKLDVMKGTVDSKVFSTFMMDLVSELSSTNKKISGKPIFFMDSAPVHKSIYTLRELDKLGISVLFN
jgi:hypothetical protein